MKYYAEQKYYDNGKTSAKILKETDMDPMLKKQYDTLNAEGVFNIDYPTYDLWIEVCDTYAEAVEIRRQTLNA